MIRLIIKNKVVTVTVLALALASGSIAFGSITKSNSGEEKFNPLEAAKIDVKFVYKSHFEAWRAYFNHRYGKTKWVEDWSVEKVNDTKWIVSQKITLVKKGKVFKELPTAKWVLPIPLDRPIGPDEQPDTKNPFPPINRFAKKLASLPPVPNKFRKTPYRLPITALYVSPKKILIRASVESASDLVLNFDEKSSFDWGLLKTLKLMRNRKDFIFNARLKSTTRFRQILLTKKGRRVRVNKISIARIKKLVAKEPLSLELTWSGSRELNLRSLMRKRVSVVTVFRVK